MPDNVRSQDALTIERTFDAPADVIWQMWTDPRHFAAWYGPAGSAVTVVNMNVRVGGSRLVRMEVTTPNGPMQMWFTGEYLEIIDGKRLVYTESMSNANGDVVNPSELGMPAAHPTTTEVRVELEDLGGRTRMVLTHIGIPAGSPGAAGWAMAIDKLAAHVVTSG